MMDILQIHVVTVLAREESVCQRPEIDPSYQPEYNSDESTVSSVPTLQT